MAAPNTMDLVNSFCAQIETHLDRSQLDGPVRMDNTHTIVIIPVKGKGPVHAHRRGGLDESGVDDIVQQIASVPSLKGLIRG